MNQSSQLLVEAYERGYRPDEQGRIVSPYERILKLSKGSNGYLLFGMRLNGVTKVIYVHRFVAYCKYKEELFTSDCVRHVNSNKNDNSPSNIELGTMSQNFQDNELDWKSRFAFAGAKTRRKLSEEQVKEIKELLKTNSMRSIAKKFNVASTTISQIKEGKSYAWVQIE